MRQQLQVGATLGQLQGKLAPRPVEHAAALVEFAEHAVGMGIEQLTQLRIGLAQRRSQQAFGEDQSIVRLVEQHRATENPLVFRRSAGAGYWKRTSVGGIFRPLIQWPKVSQPARVSSACRR